MKEAVKKLELNKRQVEMLKVGRACVEYKQIRKLMWIKQLTDLGIGSITMVKNDYGYVYYMFDTNLSVRVGDHGEFHFYDSNNVLKFSLWNESDLYEIRGE